MENWEKETKEEAREWAKRFNKIGFHSDEMGDFLKELSIHWRNEAHEWRDEFVRTAKTEKIVFLIDVWTM